MPAIFARTAPPPVTTADSLGPGLITRSIILAVIAFVVACQRVIFVFIRRKSIGIEEFLLIAAVLLLIAMTVINCAAVNNGFGRHMADFKTHGGDLTKALYYSYISLILYHVIIPIKKLIFLTLYLRLFPYRLTPLLSRITIAIVSIGGIAFLLPTIFPCLPISAFYDLMKAMHNHPKCINVPAVAWSWLAFDIATELWIVILPIPALSKLQSPVARRVGVSILLTLGAVGVAIGVGRTISLATSSKAEHRGDLTYDPTRTLNWSHGEAAVGIICTCLPSLKQPFQKMWGVGMSMSRSVRSSVSRSASRLSIDYTGNGKDSLGRRPSWRSAEAQEIIPPLPNKPLLKVGERPIGLFEQEVDSKGDLNATISESEIDDTLVSRGRTPEPSTTLSSFSTVVPTGSSTQSFQNQQPEIRPNPARRSKSIDLVQARDRTAAMMQRARLARARDLDIDLSPMSGGPGRDSADSGAALLKSPTGRVSSQELRRMREFELRELKRVERPSQAYLPVPTSPGKIEGARQGALDALSGRTGPRAGLGSRYDGQMETGEVHEMPTRKSQMPNYASTAGRSRGVQRVDDEDDSANKAALSAAMSWSSFGSGGEHEQEVWGMLDRTP